ncbi:MAG: superoxide dismutase [Candidatus Falkowbacteria bacterium]|nr:superoxide dismutase [Candidatus Falkowbacteria bacterium]
MFTLPLLPYEKMALEPSMSARTLEFHYGKHHQTYIDNLNKLVIGTGLEQETLENIIIKTANNPDKVGIFNNAAQAYNHDFFWRGLRPATVPMEPAPELLALINKNFTSLDNFYNEFKAAAIGVFGSGWVWLVKDGENLKIMKTANADNPLAYNLKPLWVLDVWEHAYYLDYQNRRADYIEAVLRNLVNWKFVAANL